MSLCSPHYRFVYFHSHATATSEIYTLSLHDALPILAACGGTQLHGKYVTSKQSAAQFSGLVESEIEFKSGNKANVIVGVRSEEHTSELQSYSDLVCRLLLEKKKKEKKEKRWQERTMQ